MGNDLRLRADLEEVEQRYWPRGTACPTTKSPEWMAEEADVWEKHGHPEFAARLRLRIEGAL